MLTCCNVFVGCYSTVSSVRGECDPFNAVRARWQGVIWPGQSCRGYKRGVGLTDESLADTGIWSGVVTPSCEPTDSGQRSELVSVASTWATTQLAPIETRPCTDSALESVYTVSPGGSPANLGQQPPDAPSPTSDRRPRPASGHPLQRLCPCLLPNGLLIFTFSTSLFSQVHGDGRRA